MSDDEKFDGVLLSIVQQAGGIDGFFESVFGFLRRKTDFFTDQKRAEQVIVTHSSNQFKKWDALKKQEEEEKKRRQEREEAKKRAQTEAATKKETVPEKKEEPKPQPTPTPKQTETVAAPTEEKKEATEGEEKKEKPPGNGGKTDKYVWTQTLEELHMYIPVPQDTRAKNMNINIGTTKCLVAIKGQTPIIDGEFTEKIKADDSIWTVEDGEDGGKVVHLAIQKWAGQWHWWDCAIKGDAKIDTQKIEPESSNLADLDGETRATVEKMMFDQRQKQMGLPSSDELKKQEMLQNFMKQHPEMDFSKVKFN